MGEFKPVTTLDDLLSLDEGEVLEGYRDGFDGAPEPGNNRSRSYTHGWRNGRVDAGRAQPDEAMRALTKAVTYRNERGALVLLPAVMGRADA